MVAYGILFNGETAMMTFEQMMDAEPRLKTLYRAAQMIGRKKVNGFCANLIWYSLFKPQLVKVVGWKRPAPSEIALRKPVEFVHDPGFLGTSDAYATAYHEIYNALPDCAPNCGCW